jgi:hypothetical protein
MMELQALTYIWQGEGKYHTNQGNKAGTMQK